MGRREPVEEDSTGGHQVPRLTRAGAALRGLAIDIGPLRRSREYRLLWFGHLFGLTGRQITTVALPYQVFVLTRSSLAVGLIGLVQLVPLMLFSLAAGPIVDRVDRRKLILGTEIGLAATSGLLMLGALADRTPLWYVYSLAGLQAGLSGVSGPARSAAIPNLVSRRDLPSAMALSQVLFNGTMVVGPSVAGLILARFGLGWAYGADVLTYAGSIAAIAAMRPLRPDLGGAQPSTAWQSLREGFRFLRGKRVLVSTFLIDLNAMVFGMPRALFPVLALEQFRVGPEGLGLLYAAPAAGALAGALTAGWVGRVRHQGRAVIWAVAVWGAAIAAFGLSGTMFWLGLLFLAVAGAADMVSAVFRSTILQASVPDALRGRLSAIHIMVVTGGPRLGDLEAGAVASLAGPRFSVVSGGVACMAGVALLGALVPQLRRYHAVDLGPERPVREPGGDRAEPAHAARRPDAGEEAARSGAGWEGEAPPRGRSR